MITKEKKSLIFIPLLKKVLSYEITKSETGKILETNNESSSQARGTANKCELPRYCRSSFDGVYYRKSGVI
jgi:hypothetical protein